MNNEAIQLIELFSTSSDLSHVLNDDEIITLAHLIDETISTETTLSDEGAPECSYQIVGNGEICLSHSET